MELIVTIGTSLVLSSLLAAGPMALLLLRHPSRSSSRLHFILHRAGMAVQILCFAVVLTVLLVGNQASQTTRERQGVASDASQGTPAAMLVPLDLASQPLNQADETPSGGPMLANVAELREENVLSRPELDEAIPWSGSPVIVGSSGTGYIRLFLLPLIRGHLSSIGLVGLYGVGVAFLLTAAAVFSQRRRERKIESTGRAIGLNKVRIVVSDSVAIPWSSGIIAPRIFLSTGDSHNHRSRRAILAHELSHVRRSDGLRALGEMCLRALFWSNPAIYSACERGRLLLEIAADSLAAHRIGETEYPRALWHVASRVNRGKRPLRLLLAGGAVAMLNHGRRRAESQVRTRIERLSHAKTRSATRLRRVGVAVALVALSAIVIACSSLPPVHTPDGMRIDHYDVHHYDSDGRVVREVGYDPEGRVIYAADIRHSDDGLLQSAEWTDMRLDNNGVEEQSFLEPTPRYSSDVGFVVPSQPSVPTRLSGIDGETTGVIFATDDGATVHAATYHIFSNTALYLGWTYRYDKMGRLVEIISTISGRDSIRRFEYDGPRCIGYEKTVGGEPYGRGEYGYDDLGRVVRTTSWQNDALDRIVENTYYPRRAVSVTLRPIVDDGDDSEDRTGSQRYDYVGFPPATDDAWKPLYDREKYGVEVKVHESQAQLLSEEEADYHVRNYLIDLLLLIDNTAEEYGERVSEIGDFRHRFVLTFGMSGFRTELQQTEPLDETPDQDRVFRRMAVEWKRWGVNAPTMQLSLPVTYNRLNGKVTVVFEQSLVRSVAVPEHLGLQASALLGDQRYLAIGFSVAPGGEIVRPVPRGFGPADVSGEWLRAINQTLLSTNLGPTGFDAPISLVMSMIAIDDGIDARLWATDRDAEHWLMDRSGEEPTL